MKNYLYRGLLYGWHNFRSWVIDLRTICVFLCVMIFLYENILGVATIANSYNLGFTPWLLPFMATTRIVDLVLWLALLLLLCDLGVEKRFDIYMTETAPVIDYYRKQGKLITIDGTKEPEETLKSLITLLGVNNG